MARRNSTYGRPAHYLRRIWLDPKKIADRRRYPYNLPLFADDDFELRFETEITIIVGENGAGKSTLLGGIAKLAGYDEARGGKGYRPVDHSRALDVNGGALAGAFRASWLPKITQGWFFRAESFFSVARYLDVAAVDVGAVPPNFLSRSHGEGFLRFFAERCERQGIYLFDAPESALSPEREIEFLKLLRRMRDSRKCQVIMATIRRFSWQCRARPCSGSPKARCVKQGSRISSISASCENSMPTLMSSWRRGSRRTE